METKKLIQTAAVLDRVLKILQGFLIAGVIVLLIFFPLVVLLGKEIMGDPSALKVGGTTLRFKGDPIVYLDYAKLKFGILIRLVAAILGCCVGWYGLRVLRTLAAPMKEGQPLDRYLPATLRKLGWIVLIGGGVTEVCEQTGVLVTVNAYRLERLLVRGPVTEVTSELSIRSWFIVGAGILFLVAGLLSCGHAARPVPAAQNPNKGQEPKKGKRK